MLEAPLCESHKNKNWKSRKQSQWQGRVKVDKHATVENKRGKKLQRVEEVAKKVRKSKQEKQ